MGDDARTKSIVIYMESIGDARAFLSAAREVALSKPIIVIKAGRTAAAARAAASHTGALTGSDAVLDAAFRRSGVLRVQLDVGAVRHRRGAWQAAAPARSAPGDRDQRRRRRACWRPTRCSPTAASWRQLSPQTLAALDAELPPHWSHGNPVDLLGDADAGAVREGGGGGGGRSRMLTACW